MSVSYDTRSTAPYSAIVKPVSALCNLACDYCYYRRVAAMYPEAAPVAMADEVLEALTLQVLQDSGPRAVFAWQGGEPLLAGREFYERAFRLQRRHAARGQVVSNTIQTNGTLIDEEWCRLFRERQVLVGLSLDGPAGLHDANRSDPGGHPSHAAVMRAMELMQRHGIAFNALSVVSAATVGHGRDVFRFLAERGLTWLQFIPCVERDESGALTPHSVDGPSYGRFLCEVFDEWYPAWVGTVSVRTFENIAQRATGGPPELCVFSPTCGNAVVVERDGDVYACDHFVYESYRLGNLLEAPLRQLVRREPCQRLAAAKMAAPARCATCPYEGLCYGGCPKERYDAATGTFGEHGLCEGYRMLFEHAFEPIREIGWRIVRGESPLAVGTDLRRQAAARRRKGR